MTTLTHGNAARGPACKPGQQQQPEPQDLLLQLIEWIGAALERSRQRRALASLSDHQLHDIGLSRADVAGETAKPFWRV